MLQADQDLIRLKSINVDSAAFLAAQCGSLGSRLVYISTDYVFDGGVTTGVGAAGSAAIGTVSPSHSVSICLTLSRS